MSRTGILAVLAVVLAGTASAETITVCSKGCDYTSINAAIAAASDGDVIQLAAETYQEGVEIDTLGKAITLRGTVGADGVPTSVLDGQCTHRVLVCQSAESSDTQLQHLVIRNGASDGGGAGVYCHNANPTIQDCAFDSNAAASGGSILISNDTGFAAMYITGCRFIGNSAVNNGGAIDAQGAAVIAECHFESNSSWFGGAIGISHNDVQIIDCTFSSNHAAYQGGAIAVFPSENAPPPVIDSSMFLNNSADGEASVVYLVGSYSSPAQLTIGDSVFCGNATPLFGGFPWTSTGGNCFAVDCTDSDSDGTLEECDRSAPATLSVPSQYPTIQDAILAASMGDVIQVEAGLYLLGQTIDTLGKIVTIRGAVNEDHEPVTILDGQATVRVLRTTTGELAGTRFENLVIRNGAADKGAGMANFGTSPTIVNCVFEGNVATEQGGGMYTYNWFGSPLVESTKFIANSALSDGGGSYVLGSVPVFRYCAFIGNVADRGGGIRSAYSRPIMIQCWFEDNYAVHGGGVFSRNEIWYVQPGLVPAGSTTFEQCTFRNNASGGWGGGIDHRSGPLVVSSCVFEGNSAGSRGGAVAGSASLQVSATEFVSNIAGVSGGALFFWGNLLAVSSCWYDGSSAPVGSSIHNLGSGVTLTDCTLTSCCAISPPGSFTDGGGNDYQAWCDDCRADVNCQDDAVDAADLSYMLGVWGTADPQCDITGDGIVDGADLGALLISWGPCP